MVCPYGKADCQNEPIYGNYDLTRQCWLYFNDECDENASHYKAINSQQLRTNNNPEVNEK